MDLIAGDVVLAVEFMDVHYAVDEQVLSGRGHPRGSRGVAPLKEIADNMFGKPLTRNEPFSGARPAMAQILLINCFTHSIY